MKTLMFTLHFLLHDYVAHLSNVLKLSRRIVTQWNILYWKYKVHNFFLFGYKHKIHEFVIFNQTTNIDAHEEKYFHSN